MTSRRSVSGGVVASLVTCALFACSYRDNDDQHDNNNFRADVIECEDALDRLETCCNGVDLSAFSCDFSYDHTEGCGSSTTQSIHPTLTTDESRCIRDTACDVLRSSGVCSRAASAGAYSSYVSTSAPIGSAPTSTQSGNDHAPVCP